jgi:CRP-like cAMP-binding protein
MTLPAADILIRKLQSNNALSEGNRRAIRELELKPRPLEADHDIVRHGERPSQCAIIIAGRAYRCKILSSGKRQIFAIEP